MKEKVKARIISVLKAIELSAKYLSAVIGPAIGIAGAIIICGLAMFAFYYETAAKFLETWYYYIILNGFYAIMLAASLGSVIVTAYKTGKKQLLSPKNKAEEFRYFNGFIMGLVAAAPFIALCIVATVRGASYYMWDIDYTDYVVELIKMFSFVYVFPFSAYQRATDFAYISIIFLSLIPIVASTLSYIAPKVIVEIKENKKKKAEAA